jgi:hypothetical protein
VEPPTVDTPPDVTQSDGGHAFADTVIAIGTSSGVMACVDSAASCGTGAQAMGACGDNAALGPNDGKLFDLGTGGRIELAFLCSAILETGSRIGAESPDFKIWSTLASNAKAVVEVSFDGSSYQQLDYLATSNQSFALERSGLQQVRFVRISDIAGGGVQIDAVEAL